MTAWRGKGFWHDDEQDDRVSPVAEQGDSMFWQAFDAHTTCPARRNALKRLHGQNVSERGFTRVRQFCSDVGHSDGYALWLPTAGRLSGFMKMPIGLVVMF